MAWEQYAQMMVFPWPDFSSPESLLESFLAFRGRRSKRNATGRGAGLWLPGLVVANNGTHHVCNGVTFGLDMDLQACLTYGLCCYRANGGYGYSLHEVFQFLLVLRGDHGNEIRYRG